MNGLDNHYANMLADHQRMLDEQAQKEEEMDSFKDKIALLLEENHPAELDAQEYMYQTGNAASIEEVI